MSDSPSTTVAATAGPPPSADIQDPLPEGSFFWRRVFSYCVSVVILALLALVVWRLNGDDELRQVALYLCLLLFMVITYYMIAPSAEQVVRMLQTAKLFTRGVRTTSTATAEDKTGRATTTTTTGLPPQRAPGLAPPQRGGEVTSSDAAPTSRRQP